MPVPVLLLDGVRRKHELFRSLLELTTTPAARVADAVAELERLRAETTAGLDEPGLSILASGTGASRTSRGGVAHRTGRAPATSSAGSDSTSPRRPVARCATRSGRPGLPAAGSAPRLRGGGARRREHHPTLCGISDRSRRALRPRHPIPGLLAAGTDAGGISSGGYSSGLGAALVLGRVAASTALGG